MLYKQNTLNEFLVVHPAHIKSEERELIPISEFFSDSFLTSQDTELVNAARIAGAKKVTILQTVNKLVVYLVNLD